MKRDYIEQYGYFDLEYLCEYEKFECYEFFVLLKLLENGEINIDEYIKKLKILENENKQKFPEKFEIGGLIF